jgi:K+-transporting ATPase KdpF subunit
MPSPVIISEVNVMSIDYALGAIVTVGLLVYLVYALIRPEKF